MEKQGSNENNPCGESLNLSVKKCKCFKVNYIIISVAVCVPLFSLPKLLKLTVTSNAGGV